MTEDTFDAIVIGGGPGGYVAAIRLGQLGLRALVVEQEALGGVCLNWGCIPTKALINAAGLVQRIREADGLGIGIVGMTLDVPKLQRWKDGIVERLTGGVADLVAGSGGRVAFGTARLVARDAVEVRAADGGVRTYRARRGIVLATGTSVATVPGFEPDGRSVLTAREAVSLSAVPASLLVIGGGVIAVELGMAYQKLGSRVTLVEQADQLLPGLDADLVRVVERRFRARGGEVLTGARALELRRGAAGAEIVVERQGQQRTLSAEKVLVAVGFRPRSQHLGLEALGVATDPRGHVVVDAQQRTNVPGVFAIGDVAGAPYLAHKAFKEGEIAAEVIAGQASKREWRALPMAVFSDPEIAVVGLSEREARQRGIEVKIGRFPLVASGRALSLGETEGFVKVLSDPGENEILGVGIVGAEASELIGEATLAIEMMAAPGDLALTIHAHPTLSEGLMEAHKHLLGEAVHIGNRPARAGTLTA